jgi:hypothetical protein
MNRVVIALKIRPIERMPRLTNLLKVTRSGTFATRLCYSPERSKDPDLQQCYKSN